MEAGDATPDWVASLQIAKSGTEVSKLPTHNHVSVADLQRPALGDLPDHAGACFGEIRSRNSTALAMGQMPIQVGLVTVSRICPELSNSERT
jgi:hypothetical protein